MTFAFHTRLLAALFVIAIGAGVPSSLLAGVQEDFNRLCEKCYHEIERGDYQQAEKTALSLKKIAETELRHQPLTLPWVLERIGLIYKNQGWYAESESFLRQALRGYEKTLGKGNAPEMGCLLTLANLYKQQSRYAEALHQAKRWVRSHEQWKSPYYWGTFVLLGPN